MKIFFKAFFASLLALFVFSLLGVFILGGIAGSFAKEEAVIIPQHAVLVLDLSESFEERHASDPLTEFMDRKKGKKPSLSELVELISNAKTDSAIKGIYIKAVQNPNGFAASEEIRNALVDFKTSGKFILAYGETITQKAYMIANVADKIFTHPQGGLEWNGFNYETMFLKGLLDKLEITPQVFYAGKFKSATEPLRYTEMSEPNKVQTKAWLNGIYQTLLQNTAASRSVSVDTLFAKVKTAFDAVKYHLIDAILYDDQFKKVVSKSLHQKDNEEISFVNMHDYAGAVTLRKRGADKIAIVFANGDIVMGKDQKESIASDDYRILLQKLRKDESIKAVVLRVNSPGGSSLASDIIWREIDLLKKEKPVVVSMGDYAASGGYYISCGADSIIADANTITGSIGVFSIIPNFKGLMNNKLGISFDGVKTGKYSDFPTSTRPLTEVEKHFMQSGVDSIYYTFKSRVAAGRKRTVEYIDSIAQGRVWTGKDAVANGLVDKIGDLHVAIKVAASMAHLKSYGIKTLPEEKSFFESFLEDYKEETKVKVAKELIGQEQFNIMQQVQSLQQWMMQPQARLPIFVVNKP
jgi:protease-4